MMRTPAFAERIILLVVVCAVVRGVEIIVTSVPRKLKPLPERAIPCTSCSIEGVCATAAHKLQPSIITKHIDSVCVLPLAAGADLTAPQISECDILLSPVGCITGSAIYGVKNSCWSDTGTTDGWLSIIPGIRVMDVQVVFHGSAPVGL